MRILAIREKTFPIASPIRNAYIDFSKMTLSAVALVTDVVRDGKRVVGYGFNSNGRYGQGCLLRERFIPRLMDAVAKIAGRPLYRWLAERFGSGEVDRKVFVYAAGGYYYAGKDNRALQDEMKSYLDRGYTVVKMKI